MSEHVRDRDPPIQRIAQHQLLHDNIFDSSNVIRGAEIDFSRVQGPDVGRGAAEAGGNFSAGAVAQGDGARVLVGVRQAEEGLAHGDRWRGRGFRFRRAVLLLAPRAETTGDGGVDFGQRGGTQLEARDLRRSVEARRRQGPWLETRERPQARLVRADDENEGAEERKIVFALTHDLEAPELVDVVGRHARRVDGNRTVLDNAHSAELEIDAVMTLIQRLRGRQGDFLPFQNRQIRLLRLVPRHHPQQTVARTDRDVGEGLLDVAASNEGVKPRRISESARREMRPRQFLHNVLDRVTNVQMRRCERCDDGIQVTIVANSDCGNGEHDFIRWIRR